MIAVANNERLPDSQPGGMPNIPPEVLQAFKNMSPDEKSDLDALKHHQPAVAAWLYQEAERRFREAEKKSSFIKGFLAATALLNFDREYAETIRPLEEMYKQASYTDDLHTDPPISA